MLRTPLARTYAIRNCESRETVAPTPTVRHSSIRHKSRRQPLSTLSLVKL